MPSSTSRRKVARCIVPECNKQVQTRKLCKAHGGGVRCQGPKCRKLAQSRGLCVAHGGGRRCGFEDCNKLAQYKGLCLSHGGGRRCGVTGCQKFVQIRGCCKAHAKRFTEEATRGASAAADNYPSKFDIPLIVGAHEQRILSSVKKKTLSSVISQDPADHHSRADKGVTLRRVFAFVSLYIAYRSRRLYQKWFRYVPWLAQSRASAFK
ncbi:hypothetical protein PC115_g10831 [Phytophthora cactorum]|uniref:WRKY19-like zinc finger domain-containing protein n=1 Tax=Phytophthora cactorum TaxID=29920 RepID=A0A8T1CCT2_9STRA|nr:hypothetical protein PC115_g10831 [Phytophthora cactorum]